MVVLVGGDTESEAEPVVTFAPRGFAEAGEMHSDVAKRTLMPDAVAQLNDADDFNELRKNADACIDMVFPQEEERRRHYCGRALGYSKL